MKVFIGVDSRQYLSYNVCRFSIERRASKPVQIMPLRLDWMPIKRRGLTDFSFSRYLVPYLCGYEGEALFMDPDMLVLDDIHKLSELAGDEAVSVVKNTKRFEWSSLMYFRNSQCRQLTPELIESGAPQSFSWAPSVGALPSQWNHLVGYDAPRDDAKIVHYTMGIPCWPETSNCEYSHEWKKEANQAMGSVSWQELMGNSVHVPHISNLSTT